MAQAATGTLFNGCTGCIDYTGTTITSTTLPSGSTQYIQNTSSLQPGSSFYVYGGTIGNNLTVNNSLTANTASGNIVIDPGTAQIRIGGSGSAPAAGFSNITVGVYAGDLLEAASTGNVLYGLETIAFCTTGCQNNVVVGNGAMRFADPALRNTVIGNSAGGFFVSGDDNVYAGASSGGGGSKSIALGAVASASCDNCVAVGYSAAVTTDNTMQIGGSGALKMRVNMSSTTISSATITGQAQLSSIRGSLLATNGSGVIVSTTIVRSYSLYTSTADQTINTTTPTTAHSSACIGTTTVNANFFAVGSKFQVRGQGIYSTPLGNVATVTITLKYGTTTLATVTTGSLPASATNLPFGLWIDCTVRAIGASGTMICNGSFFYDTALTGIVETQNALISGAVTVDTTAAKTIDTLGSWSATTTQSAVVQQSSVLLLN